MSIQINGQVRYGTVKFFLKNRGYGFIIPDIAGRDIHFRREDGSGVIAGVNGPEPTYAGLQSPWSQDRVAYTVSNESPTRVSWWSYERDYRIAARAISLYPVVRIMEQHSFRGESAARNPHTVVGETKLPQLLEWLRRGTVTFLPHVQAGNRTTTQWVETKVDGVWSKEVEHLELLALARHQNPLAA